MIKYLNNRKFARHEQMEINVKVGPKEVSFTGIYGRINMSLCRATAGNRNVIWYMDMWVVGYA
jgi:hypothetical protein